MDINHFANLVRKWGDCRIIKKIGEGVRGIVFLAERDGTCALKISTVTADDYEITSNSLREVKFLKELCGEKNIVRLIDSFVIHESEGNNHISFVFMEALNDITEIFNSQIPNLQTIIKLGTDICDAITQCTSHKILHRDIQPRNILADNENTFKLCDFGSAESMKGYICTTAGTYAYMAPEVYLNRPYGEPADIYSLGITLYTILNDMCIPFTDKSADHKSKLRAIEKRLSGVPLPEIGMCCGDIYNVISKMCAYNEDERYQTAQAAKNALKELY